MSELKRVMDIAYQVLTTPTPKGGPDTSLCDRAERLAANAEFICLLPELTDTNRQIDYFCLTVAAYFCDTGPASLIKNGKNQETPGVFDANSSRFLELSADIAAKKLETHLQPAKIEKIATIISESADHFTTMTEAMILSDARNLDDMGAAGVFNEIKRSAFAGKGLTGFVKSWRKKVDYGYWQARLQDGFHFDSVRRIAEQRLYSAETFITQLDTEIQAADIKEFSTDSALV